MFMDTYTSRQEEIYQIIEDLENSGELARIVQETRKAIDKYEKMGQIQPERFRREIDI